MYHLNIQDREYSDPWTSTFHHQISRLARDGHRVAYYYDRPDNSTFRYRVYNMIQTLDHSDLPIASAYFQREDLDQFDEVLNLADTIVVCRAKYTHKLNRMITRAKNRGISVLYDIDDFVFDTSAIHLVIDTLDQPRRDTDWDFWFADIGRIGAALKLCDGVITTNTFLGDRLQRFTAKPAYIVPNFLNQEQLTISEQIYQQKKERQFSRNNRLHLGYFSGTPSHNKDFELILESLVQLLQDYPHVSLRIVGYMDPKEVLSPFSRQVEYLPFTDFINLQRLIGETEVNLVPLQDNEFTNCKSQLKYFEAGVVGSLTVASPTFTYKESIEHGQNGFLANSYQWYDTLAAIIESFDSTRPILERAYTRSHQEFAWHNQVDRLADIFFNQSTERQEFSSDESLIIEVQDLGERLVEAVGGGAFEAHLSIYEFAQQFVENKDVLDAGCGAGYGSFLFARKGAASVIGLDISQKAIDYSQRTYTHPNLVFMQQDLQLLDLAPQSLDFVFSSNALEHLSEVDKFFHHIISALRSNGQLVLAVPPICSELELEINLENGYHLSNLYFEHWISKTKRFFKNVSCFMHILKEGIKADFGPDSLLKSKDFLIEAIDCSEFRHTGSMSLILLATSPRQQPLSESEEVKGYPVDWNPELVKQALDRLQPDEKSVEAKTPQNRIEKILDLLEPGMKLLEIGALHNPLISRSNGWNAYFLDHATGDELREKYRNDPKVDISRIQEVDFVWKSGELHTAVPDEHLGTFDGVIASHVIEHTPDMIGFLKSINHMLKWGGYLTLAVPDKRFCFDYFQSITLTGRILDNHFRKRTRHSRMAAFNNFAYNVKSGEVTCWGQHPTEKLAFLSSDPLNNAYHFLMNLSEEDTADYVDLHGNYFTPSSFRLICLELAYLGLVPFEEVGFYDTDMCEFYVTLRKAKDITFESVDEIRLRLLKNILREVREQSDYLLMNAP